MNNIFCIRLNYLGPSVRTYDYLPEWSLSLIDKLFNEKNLPKRTDNPNLKFNQVYATNTFFVNNMLITAIIIIWSQYCLQLFAFK